MNSQFRLKIYLIVVIHLAMLWVFGCFEPGPPPCEVCECESDVGNDVNHHGRETGDGSEGYPDVSDNISYREVHSHPGCSTAGLSYPAAQIAGFGCAATEYVGAEDTSKPIVLLIHGNSDTPEVWEVSENPGPLGDCDPVGATQGVDMLAERLAAEGFRVFALDLRTDLVDDPDDCGSADDCNPAHNMDHGWGVPLAQHLIETVLDAYPDRQISLVGHSFGATVIRDALRRLFINDGVDIWPRIDEVILLAGSHHGVSTYYLCSINPTMRGQVTCEMGNRSAYSPTDFLTPLNGPDGIFETPCSDGYDAYGRPDACSGNTVHYTTIVMEDMDDGTQQDLFVSEASSHLDGAENLTIGLNDFDESDYFFCGLFRNHYGAARSLAAVGLIMDRLRD